MDKARVLVVDDDQTIRELLRRLLERAGYEVVLAIDGLEAIALTEAMSPNLVIADVNMPTLDGVSMLQDMRAYTHTADLPIIVMSALATSQVHLRCLDLKAKAVITKPFSNDEILMMVEQVLMHQVM